MYMCKFITICDENERSYMPWTSSWNSFKNVACLIIENTTAFAQDSLQIANYKSENLHVVLSLGSLFKFSLHALINREVGREVSA